MAEISNVAEMRIEPSHNGDDGVSHFVAFFFVLDSAGISNEFLDVSAVFRNFELRELSVVVHDEMKKFMMNKFCCKSKGIMIMGKEYEIAKERAAYTFGQFSP